MANHLEACPHPLQHLGNIFAQNSKSAAAIGAGLMVWHVGMDFAGKMRGKWTTERLRGNWPIDGRDRRDLFDSACCLQLFELQLQLFDLAEDLLAPGAEEHALQLLDQQHQALNLARTGTQGRRVRLMLRSEVIVLSHDHRLQCCAIQSVQIGQAEGVEHERSMT